ncbi:mCG145774, partial [Mus musculus]
REHRRRGTRSHRQPAETRQGTAELRRPPPRSRRPTSVPPSRLPCQPPPCALPSRLRLPQGHLKHLPGEATRTPRVHLPPRPRQEPAA